MARWDWKLLGVAVPDADQVRRVGLQPTAPWPSHADLRCRALGLLCDGQLEDAEALMHRLAAAGDIDAMERLGAWHVWGPRLLGPGPWRRSTGLTWLERAAQARSRQGTGTCGTNSRRANVSRW